MAASPGMDVPARSASGDEWADSIRSRPRRAFSSKRAAAEDEKHDDASDGRSVGGGTVRSVGPCEYLVRALLLPKSARSRTPTTHSREQMVYVVDVRLRLFLRTYLFGGTTIFWRERFHRCAFIAKVKKTFQIDFSYETFKPRFMSQHGM
jgi:hypothetical protein